MIVKGDSNRSLDSRIFGPVALDTLFGVAIARLGHFSWLDGCERAHADLSQSPSGMGFVCRLANASARSPYVNRGECPKDGEI